MKTFLPQKAFATCSLLVVLGLFLGLSVEAQTYTTIANGAWTSSSTWQGGSVPPTNGSITSGMVINIKHTVTYSSSSISNSGTINISNTGGIAPALKVASGINITNNSTGVINVNEGELRQYRFSGGGESGTSQTGSFVNNGGKVNITTGFVEIAQNWTNQNGGTVVFNNSSLEIGGAYNLNNNSTDSILTTSISVGMQGTGNFSVSGGSANAYYDSIRVEVASTSGSFTLQSGKVNGLIDYIGLSNHVTGGQSSGQIIAASALSVTSLRLNSYCINNSANYVPNGKISGSQTENCSLSYFPATLMTPASALRLNYSTNPVLISGTALTVGAQYRYENAKADMDVIVTIDSIVGGLVINNIDDNSGSNGGYLEAFQPIMTSGSTVGYSYAVFSFDFVVTGTTTPYKVDTAKVTAIDIDGTSNLYEFDQINMAHGGTAGYLSFSPAISLTQTGAGTFMGIDVDGISQPGVDTTARGNMFTTTNYNISSYIAKLGMKTTQSQKSQRLFSLYPSDFNYPIYSVLPVVLESFTAALNGQATQVNLNWITSAQVNVNHFIVERSLDGTNFDQAGVVFPNENGGQNVSYSFPDDISSLQNPMIYYRLCTVDIDGSVQYSSIRLIRIEKQVTNTIAVQAYPNPVTSELRVTIPSEWQNKQVTYQVFNTNGQLAAKVDQGSGSQTQTINVADLAPGMYIVNVRCQGQTAQSKILKF